MWRPGMIGVGTTRASVRRRRRDPDAILEAEIRVTEDDIPRITEDGEVRITEA